MFYTLMLALVLSNGSLDSFKETKLICSDHKYIYDREGDSNIYLRNNTEDYATKFNTADSLNLEIKKQCQK